MTRDDREFLVVLGAIALALASVAMVGVSAYHVGVIEGRQSMPIVCGEDSVRVTPGVRKGVTGWPR